MTKRRIYTNLNGEKFIYVYCCVTKRSWVNTRIIKSLTWKINVKYKVLKYKSQERYVSGVFQHSVHRRVTNVDKQYNF